MSQSALITGGAGFIGSHVADRLLARGFRVVALDNFAIGREGNVAHLRSNPAFSLVKGEITDRETLIRLVKDNAVDVIFHLAAVHYIPFCTAHPFEAMRINVLGTQAVIDAAAEGSVTRIVFASTSDVYAIKDAPLVETDPVGPYTVYGNTKLMSEQLLRLATTMNPKLSVSVARLFNVYGPRETNPHVLPEILDQLKNGATTLCLGNLWPRRDFIFVGDVADAFVALVNSADRFDVFNVGSGQATTIRDAVTTIAGLAGRAIDVVEDPERTRPVERATLHSDPGKISRVIGWSAQRTFRDGMAAWMQAEGLSPSAVPTGA